MSTAYFQVTEHVIPCQHIREYPHAIKADSAVLMLAIKEYQPLDNVEADPGSLTIVALHANGIPKETYEPLFDDLYNNLKGKVKLRAIWIADSSHQGASGVLNEHVQGDDPHFFDHSRDLLRMVNHFQDRMPRPIVGMAHSMGTTQLVQLALIHPRLFHSLALIEPIIFQDWIPFGPNPAFLTSHRPDLWPSRGEAEASFRKNPFFKIWDPRVLDNYLKYNLRDTPTPLYPTPGSVTLRTTKHQEAWSYVRSNFSPQLGEHDPVQQLLSPDLDPEETGKFVFSRAEVVLAAKGLLHLRPSVLYIFGSQSLHNPSAWQDEKMVITGTGVGGSGGAKAGRVEKVVVQGTAHMVPMDKTQECAMLLAYWLEKGMERFKAEELFYQEYNSRKSERDKLAMSKQWLNAVRQESDLARPYKEKL